MFMFLFWFYILPTILAIILTLIDDRIEGTNSFKDIGYTFIPVLNVVVVIVIPITWIRHTKVLSFIYTKYCSFTGTRDIEFERKHNIKWENNDD